MEDEGRSTGGLDPARDWSRPHRGRRGRGPYWRRSQAAGDEPRTTYAALDLGTNNCRLLVARPSGHGFRVIDAFSRIIRLGEGISASGRISEAAIERAVSALSVCRDKMRQRHTSRARLIATEACRAAENGDEFHARILNDVGLDLEIIDRKTEATLAATGCTPLMDPETDGVILFDIGGGSSELVRLGRCVPTRRGPPEPTIEGWVSIPLGVVTLAERHGGHEVTRAVFEAMIAEVTERIGEFAAAHSGDLARMHMLGTSGTVTTIAALIFVGQAQASTAEDFQYRAILAEQGGGGNAQGVGGLPFTGVNLVLLGGVGAAATVAGAARFRSHGTAARRSRHRPARLQSRAPPARRARRLLDQGFELLSHLRRRAAGICRHAALRAGGTERPRRALRVGHELAASGAHALHAQRRGSARPAGKLDSAR